MPAAPVVTRLEPLGPRGRRVRVHLDRGEPLEVTLEAIEKLRLGVGDALPANRRHHLESEDADARVREAALHLLSFRARTRRELRRRLLQKGFRPARVEVALDRLQERGLVDDAAVAAAFVRDRLRHRPRGRSRLSSELRAKGVGGDLAARVVDRVLEDEEVDDASLGRTVAEGWVRRQSAETLAALLSETRTPASAKARRRLRGHLARRGFGGDALRGAIEHAVAGARALGSGREGS